MPAFQFTQEGLHYHFNNEREIRFIHKDLLYISVGSGVFANPFLYVACPTWGTYSAPLFCSDKPNSLSDDDFKEVGKIEWDIINPEAEQRKDMCDWNQFRIYF